MPDEFKIAKDHARDMENENGERNKMYAAMENRYWMRPEEEGAAVNQIQNIKVTRSPRSRNAILAAKRLLIATDPEITIPHDINSTVSQDNFDNIEKFCKAMLFASGRISGNPIHYDAVLSGLLYSDIIIGISSTQNMLDQASNKNPAVQARLEEINLRTPYLFEVYNPISCYTERDIMGVTTFFHKVNTNVGEIEDLWGEAGKKALRSIKNEKYPERKRKVTLCDYYDLKNRFVWLDGFEKPILNEEHGMPFIPVAFSIAEGSNLFSKPEEQREPFLYSVWRSKLDERESLILTAWCSTIFSMGANPMFVEYLNDPSNPPAVDYFVPGGTVRYHANERREVMTRQLIDPAMMDIWNIANTLNEQSTLYRQAAGEPVASSTPYSSLALMSQSGRLPLIGTQRLCSHVIGEALEIALRWMKQEGGVRKAQYEDVSAQLDPASIPTPLDIKVQLEIDTPSDQLNQANAANMLAQGESPMVSKRWVRENILHIGQSDDMEQEIGDEKATDLYMRKYLLKLIMETQQMEQMAMMPPEQIGSGMPGSSVRQPVMPEGAMPQSPNFGTPQQPNQVPGIPNAQPIEPMPPLPPNQIPRGG